MSVWPQLWLGEVTLSGWKSLSHISLRPVYTSTHKCGGECKELSIHALFAPYSNIGHGHAHGIRRYAIFECGVVGRSKKSANRKFFALTTTLLSASVNGPLLSLHTHFPSSFLPIAHSMTSKSHQCPTSNSLVYAQA